MAEQVFKSPGFFEREIEVIKRPTVVSDETPVAIIGTSERGPAFVPITVSTRDDFEQVFGVTNKKMPATQAAYEFFENSGSAIQFCKTLGSGLKDEENAGFVVEPITDGSTILGNYTILAASITSSTQTGSTINGYDLTASGDLNDAATNKVVVGGIIAGKDYVTKIGVNTLTSMATLSAVTFNATSSDNIAIAANTFSSFKIGFEHDTDASKDKGPWSVSLDPSKENYISKVLNTNPLLLDEEGYVLYKHYPQETSIVKFENVTLISGVDLPNSKKLGDHSNRFKTPASPMFISQPFSGKEYDLFRFESLDDGEYAAGKYKISITNLFASTDPNNKFGNFTVVVRDLKDTDDDQIVYETFSNCNLDPNSDNFIAKVIGDKKTYFHFDAESEDERRIITEGSYDNISRLVRVVIGDDVLEGEVPQESLPVGFRGIDSLSLLSANTTSGSEFKMPPLPMRVKITKGDREDTARDTVSDGESLNRSLHWGMMTTRVVDASNPNGSSLYNELVSNILKYDGKDSDVRLSTQSEKDANNNNKFSLSKVKIGTISSLISLPELVTEVGAAAYYDRGDNDSSLSIVQILSESPVKFNRISSLCKFTAPMQGGWDGLNPFDKDIKYMTDRSVEDTEDGGKAREFDSQLAYTLLADEIKGNKNNCVASYKNAIRLMTDPLVTNNNVLVIPGIRSHIISDYAKVKVEEYSRSIYLMDIPLYDKTNSRIYVDAEGKASGKTDVINTADKFDARSINSSYTAAYFPDVMIEDGGDDVDARSTNHRIVRMPASVAALSAIATTDLGKTPWFAPAGFTRGALARVKGLDVRLNTKNRDDLYEARINPIANFPNNQFVIFGQKTTQIARTSLDRVNVRRLVLEVKRRIERIAQGLMFAQNNNATRNNFISSSSRELADIQTRSGIEGFKVIMDSTNNTAEDVDNNRLNGKIIIVPTRAVEFIQIDFVITNSGVEYP